MSKAQAARIFSVSLSSLSNDTLTQGTAGRLVSPEEETRICSEAG
jgi:hypothetical protein